MLDDQKMFFKVLQEQVHSRLGDASPDVAKARVEEIRKTMKANTQVARFVSDGGKEDGFPSQVQKVYEELTGKKLSVLADHGNVARRSHAYSHGAA